MNITKGGQGHRRAVRRRGFAIEALEGRSLMATAAETFAGPALGDLIARAEHGRNVTRAVADRMVRALESQLRAGPLADLNSGAVAGGDFVGEAQSLELGFEQDVAQQLAGRFNKRTERAFGRLGQALDLDGQRVVAGLVSLGQQQDALQINSDGFAAQSEALIGSLTAGPVRPLGTPLKGLADATSAAESQLDLLARDLAEGALTHGTSVALDPAGGSTVSTQASQAAVAQTLTLVRLTADAELEGYRASVHAATLVGQPGIAAKADAAIDKLEAAVGALPQGDLATAQSQLDSAIGTFGAAVGGKSGVFGPRGAYSRAPKVVNPYAASPKGPAASVVTSVSGAGGLTTPTAGTGSVSATLESADGAAIAGRTVNFTLGGAYLGSAVTDARGVATLSGLTTTDASDTRVIRGVATTTTGVTILDSGNMLTPVVGFGRNAGALVATFGGSSKFFSSQGKGDIDVTLPIFSTP